MRPNKDWRWTSAPSSGRPRLTCHWRRLFAAATLIGLAQATLVVLNSVAGPQDALHEFLYGAIDVLAKATLLLLALVTAAKGFTLVCTQAGGVRSASTEVITPRHTRQRWLS